MKHVTILPAEPEDLEEIIVLQRLAYESEARLCNNWNIPPLRQTLQDLEQEFAQGWRLLKAVDATGRIQGSVRVLARQGTAFVGKLMVLPQVQGKGLGTRLLAAVEQVCPQRRYELFTSVLSQGNLRLYARVGYTPFKEEDVEAGLRLVWLEKMRGIEASIAQACTPLALGK